MEGQQQAAQVLLECEGIQIYKCQNGSIKKDTEGQLRVGCIQNQNVYFMNVGEFYYTLQKQIPFVIFPNETQRTIVFPNVDNGYSAMIIPTAYECNAELDTILKTTVTLYVKDQAKEIPQIKQNIDQHLPQIWNGPIVEESKLIHYIQKGGGFLKSGFSFLGGAIATGVNKGGQWIGSKIDKNDNPKEVSQETKDKMTNIKSKATKYFTITGQYLNKVLTPVADFTNQTINDISKKIDEGDNETLKKAKQITKATGQSVNTAFQGFSQGAKQIGGAVGENTKQLVNKKYGEDYANTFLGNSTDEQQQQYQQLNQDSSSSNRTNNYPDL